MAKNSEVLKDLTASFQAAIGSIYTTEMRNADSNYKDRLVQYVAAQLFEAATGLKSVEVTPSQERSLKRALLVAAGPAGKNPYIGTVEPADIIRARDQIFEKALKSGLIKRKATAPKAG